MRGVARYAVLFAAVLGTGRVQGQDLRAVRFELPSLFRTASAGQIVENIASIRFNTLMCTVMPEEAADPRFARLLALAHSRGLQVHAVLSAMVPGGTGSVSRPDPETHAVASGGKLVSEWLCPSRPKVRGWAVNLGAAMARLGVDGLQLDYIRFGGPDLCYCSVCRNASREWISAHPGCTWEDWRESVITSFACEVRDTVKKVNPKISFSCSTWTVGKGRTRTFLTPEGEGYGWRQGQDFRQLAEIADYLRPMLYSCMLRRDAQWIADMTRLAVGNASGKTRIVAGVALTIEEEWKTCHIPANELPGIVEGIREAGAGGIALFSYVSLFDPKYAHLGYLEQVRRIFR
jgi:uncharacterized lipoprotein YddW (UPF0748 family)